MYSPEKIKSIVEEGLPGCRAEVKDLTGTNDHFQLTVVSDSFQGKGQIDRHRLVYGILGNAVGNEIHALSLKTFTPTEIKS